MWLPIREPPNERGRPGTTAQTGHNRAAGENRATTRVAPTLGRLEEWCGHTDARTGTAHDYSGENAQACLNIMGDCIDDAIGLYQAMSGETWD